MTNTKIRALNAVEVAIDTVIGDGPIRIALTLSRPGTTQGAMRAFLDLDTASVVAAKLSNHIDAARRG